MVPVVLLAVLLGAPVTPIGAAVGAVSSTPPTAPLRGALSAATGASPGASGIPLSDSMDWTVLNPSLPVGLAGAGFAVLSSAAEGVLFGGDAASGLSDQTYRYSEPANSWTVESPAIYPSARSDFGFAADASADSAVLFGGQVDLATGAVSNATWTYAFGSDSWTNVSAAVAPAPREDPGFAVGDGIALLFGGWAPNVAGTGEITYSDTWMLNLSTDAWTAVAGAGGPGALHGTSILWQPTLDEFLLFGGCYPCSSAIWAFSPAARTWTSLATSGVSPSPRMNAVWVDDPTQGLDLLYGGTNGTSATDSTLYFEPASATWTGAVISAPPAARYAAAADYFAVAGNATLLLAGGTDGTGAFSDVWRLAEVANLSVEVTNATSGAGIENASVAVSSGGVLTTNQTGFASATELPAEVTTLTVAQAGYATGNETFWMPPGATSQIVVPLTPLAPASVDVIVDNQTDFPVGGTRVTLSYDSRLYPGSPCTTDASGLCAFSNVPSATYLIQATHAGYHGAGETVDLRPGILTVVNLTIVPLFALTVRTLGSEPNGTDLALAGAEVTVGSTGVGTTGTGGYFNTTLATVGLEHIGASVYAYFNASALLNVTETGSALVVLTLDARPYPTISIEVLGQRGNSPGFQVRNASVLVQNTTSLPTGPYDQVFVTDVEGSVEFSPPVGNYSIRVSAPGFLPNDSVPLLSAPPGVAIGRTIYLQLIGFSNLEILTLSAARGNPPVGGAQFALRFSGVNLSTGLPFPPKAGGSLSTGWANFSGIPQGTTIWSVVAPGYLPANGTFAIVYGSPSNDFTVYLVPIPPPRYTGLDILPVAPTAVWSLAVLPIVCLLGALVYLTMLRNPASRERELRDAARAARTARKPPRAG